MAEIVCLNTVPCPAYRGQAIVITLSGDDALPQLTVGDGCIVDSSTATGVIASIDAKGRSFKVKPDKPEQWLGTGTAPETAKNTFDIGDSVTVTTQN